jgi:hypothetical protein
VVSNKKTISWTRVATIGIKKYVHMGTLEALNYRHLLPDIMSC